MAKATQSHREAALIAVVVALAVWLLAAPVWAQSPSSGPILTFTPGMASTSAGTGTAGYSGDGGPAISAQFSLPMGMARDGQGNLYVADFMNNVVRKIAADGTVTTVAGNGTQGYSGDNGQATSAQLAYPAAVALDNSGNLYIAEFLNSCVRKVDANGIISTLVTGFVVRGVAADSAGNVYYSSWYEGVWKVDSQGVSTRIAGNGNPGYSGDGGPATEAQTAGVAGLALDSQGNLYLAEVQNSDIRKIDTNGIITTVAGTHQAGFAGDGGAATSAQLNGPADVRVDAAGNLYIADSSNNRIRKVNAAGTISTIAGGDYGYAGDGGLASSAQFANPTALVLDGNANLFAADTANNVIREIKVDSTTLDFGTVTVGQTAGPVSVIVSNAGNADLNVSGVVASSSFGVQTTCSANTPVSPGSECAVDVSFTPLVNGNIAGMVTVSDDTAGNPHLINLKGQGHVVPVASKLVFVNQFPTKMVNGNLGSVAVNATDASGNLATGFNGAVSLQLQGPAGFTTYNAQANANAGTVTFNLTSATLNVAGSYTITASAAALSSAQATFTVTGNPDFAISLSKQSLSIGKSSTGTIAATITPTNGFTGSIALECSGLPANSACTFVPASVTASGNNASLTSVLTISTGVAAASMVAVQHTSRPLFLASTGVFGAGLLGLVFAPIARQRQHKTSKRGKVLQLTLAVIILCGGLVGCGGLAPGKSDGTPAGNYTVTVTATASGLAHSSTFTLAVQ
jgi:sugar lactone lactonase YvrE